MHEVKVFNGDGKLKKIISAEQATKNYWSNFASVKIDGSSDLSKARLSRFQAKYNCICRMCNYAFKGRTKKASLCGEKCKKDSKLIHREKAKEQYKKDREGVPGEKRRLSRKPYVRKSPE